MLQQELEKIGLSEKEAKVYLAALELGQAPVQDISKKSGVNRATTYVILESLMKKGVITTTEQGKKRLFVAESPQSLSHIIDEQREELEKKSEQLAAMMANLESVYNLHPNKPIVRFYEGKEGLKTILEERLKDAPKEVKVFFSKEDVHNVFSEDEMNAYREKRKKRGTFYKGIYSIKEEDHSSEYSTGEWQQIDHEKYPIYSDIAVYNDKVSISNLRGQVSGIVIENKAVADSISTIFSLITDLLQEKK